LERIDIALGVASGLMSGAPLGAGFALAALAGLAGDYLESLATGRVLRRLRTDLYAQVQRLGMAHLTQARTGDVLARFSSDLDALRQGVTSRLLDGVRAGVGLLMSLPVLWALDAPLAAMSCAVVPGVLLSVRALGRPARRLRRP
jgi:ATP-binding cassette subfamily B protein